MTFPRIACVLACAGLAAAAVARVPEAILQNSGDAANGYADAAQTVQIASFGRPVKSATGASWIIVARTVNGEAVYITGSQATYQMAALEGVTQLEPGRTFVASDYVGINQGGNWVGHGRLLGGAGDEEVVFGGNFTGSTHYVAFREGEVIGTGDTLGTTSFRPNISNAGVIAFGWCERASPEDVNYYLADGTVAALRNGDLLPGGGSPFSTADPRSRNVFQTTANGLSYIALGRLGSQDGPQVLVKDGEIVLAEGDDFGRGRIVEYILGGQNMLQENGDWLTAVRFTDGTGAAIKNGGILAATGDLVEGFLFEERWSSDVWTSPYATTFAVVAGDSVGNWIIGGFTDNPDTSENFVWSFNGQECLRTGMQLDVDGDGAVDDAYLSIADVTSDEPSPVGGFLTDSGYLHTTIDWVNLDGSKSGTVYIRRLVPMPVCIGDLTGDNKTNQDDLGELLANFGLRVEPGTGGDFDNDGFVTEVDLAVLLANFGCGL